MENFTETALHVYFDGNLRIYNCDACCSRWYFTFNGAECSSPGSIDGAFYMAKGAGKNPHRHRHIEGHCNNIHKGKVRVGFWVGNCNGRKLADAYTGWTTMSRIFIEEVSRAQQQICHIPSKKAIWKLEIIRQSNRRMGRNHKGQKLEAVMQMYLNNSCNPKTFRKTAAFLRCL